MLLFKISVLLFKTEAETKRPHAIVVNEVDSKPVSTPESPKETTDDAKEDAGGAVPGSTATKPSTSIDAGNKKGHCAIQ
jgi:hypothetical protein